MVIEGMGVKMMRLGGGKKDDEVEGQENGGRMGWA